MLRRGFGTGRTIPLPGQHKAHYEVKGGKSVSQVQRHIVRDALSKLRREWKDESAALRSAFEAERRTRPSSASAREERARVKQELSRQKQAFYAELRAKETAERAAGKEMAARFWARKQEVLDEARAEMVRALAEDAALWEQHPREMMNRRYRTFERKPFLTAFN